MEDVNWVISLVFFSKPLRSALDADWLDELLWRIEFNKSGGVSVIFLGPWGFAHFQCSLRLRQPRKQAQVSFL